VLKIYLLQKKKEEEIYYRRNNKKYIERLEDEKCLTLANPG